MHPLAEWLYYNKFVSGLFHTVVYCLQRELASCQSVLDLGCGPDSPVRYTAVPDRVGVDAFQPYIDASKQRGVHNKYILADFSKVQFPPKSFDAVMMIDVLEHLEEPEAEKLLQQAETWAKRKVIFTTPNGFLPQGGLDQNPFQRHRSGWTPEEFRRRGYRVYGMAGWKFLRGGVTPGTEDGNFADVRFRPRLFWVLISELTQLVTYFLPKLAFEFFAVKDLEGRGPN